MSVLEINGWKIYAHPLFLDQVDALTERVRRLEAKSPQGFRQKSATKRLAAIIKLATTVIPLDPADPKFRQGRTLGVANAHWHRAKFYQQYRLFFRFHEPSKIIILAWVNDETTKRACDSKADAYEVFRKMLGKGHPPNSWKALMAEAVKDRAEILDALPPE